jgi:hypothetical protein
LDHWITFFVRWALHISRSLWRGEGLVWCPSDQMITGWTLKSREMPILPSKSRLPVLYKLSHIGFFIALDSSIFHPVTMSNWWGELFKALLGYHFKCKFSLEQHWRSPILWGKIYRLTIAWHWRSPYSIGNVGLSMIFFLLFIRSVLYPIRWV